jgi:acetolactate synthase-1/2/3 large subunit
MSSKILKTGAQVVVESLEKHGVQYVFGIPGAKIDKVFDTLVNSSIQTDLPAKSVRVIL